MGGNLFPSVFIYSEPKKQYMNKHRITTITSLARKVRATQTLSTVTTQTQKRTH